MASPVQHTICGMTTALNQDDLGTPTHVVNRVDSETHRKAHHTNGQFAVPKQQPVSALCDNPSPLMPLSACSPVLCQYYIDWRCSQRKRLSKYSNPLSELKDMSSPDLRCHDNLRIGTSCAVHASQPVTVLKLSSIMQHKRATSEGSPVQPCLASLCWLPVCFALKCITCQIAVALQSPSNFPPDSLPGSYSADSSAGSCGAG